MKKIIMVVFLLIVSSVVSAWSADYLIGRGDVLEVAVWGVPEMSRSVIVRPDGKITLPAVGDIVADNIAPEDLGKQISESMKTYIKHPVVTVSVEQIRNNRVYVTGGNLSRVFDMANKMTLLKLMSELGDFSQVDLRNAYLYRNGKKINVNFYTLYFEGELSQDVTLEAEDIVFIPSNINNIVYVLGAVLNPQPLQYREGMRVLDAILGAGGFTEFAKEDSVGVIKKNKERLTLDLKKLKKGNNLADNVALSPGDYIIVEESLF